MNRIELELAAVCQSIAEDGELTEHEVRYLAEWLTANPSACVTVIGAKLANALNEILADGTVDTEELHRLAPLISEAIACQFSAELSDEASANVESSRIQQPKKSIGSLVSGVKNWLATRKEKREREKAEKWEIEKRKLLARQGHIRTIVSRLRDGQGYLNSGGSLVTRADERICWIEPGVLHEVKVISRRYVGGYAGTRIRVAKGISFSVGGNRGELQLLC